MRFAAATAATGRVLVICHLQHEAAFAALPGVSTLHHGNLAGDDSFGDFDHLFQIGGPSARPGDIAQLASAEAGRLIAAARPVPTGAPR